MSAKKTNESTSPATDLRKLKILMLHGYTQSGPQFRSKTRALEKALSKAFPPPPRTPHKPLPGSLPQFPGGVQLIYPTGPIKLRPADIPGFDASALQSAASEGGKGEEPDAWAWWKKSDAPDGLYEGLEEGLETVRQTIEEAGGVDGVIGFSQGAALAGLVASLLEPGRASAFPSSPAAPSFQFPSSWTTLIAALPQPQLKFAVSYSGFYAPHAAYAPFYEPKIATRFLHVIGSLDSVVQEERSEGFVERCADREGVLHPGGHFVPVGKDFAGVLVGFLRDVLSKQERKGSEDERLEDTNVPL
ncbi:dihydrofolate reductase [Diplocarpon rosae]|nr:dihydrofolate reductase [Diplocarpon rosae]